MHATAGSDLADDYDSLSQDPLQPPITSERGFTSSNVDTFLPPRWTNVLLSGVNSLRVSWLNMTYFFLSYRNPSYFSTPNTRTDIYPPLGNLSLTGVRLEDHSSLLSFSPGRPVEINSVTTTRPGDTYSSFSAGVSVPKTSPPKVRTARWSRLWFIGGLVKPRSKFSSQKKRQAIGVHFECRKSKTKALKEKWPIRTRKYREATVRT